MVELNHWKAVLKMIIWPVMAYSNLCSKGVSKGLVPC